MERINKVLTFDRWDFGGTRIVLVFAAAVIAFFQVVMPIVDWVNAAPMRRVIAAPESMSNAVTGVEIRSGVRLRHVDELRATIDHPSTMLRLQDLGAGIVVAIAALLVVWLLFRLLGRIQSGEPFVSASVWWLRGIAAVLLLFPWVQLPFTMAANGTATAEALRTAGESFEVMLPTTAFVICPIWLVIAAIAEAFARGVHLREETEGLI